MRLGPQIEMVGNDEALDHQFVDQHRPEVVERRRHAVVARDQSTYRDAPERLHAPQQGVEYFATDIFEYAIDAIRRGRLDRIRPASKLVVDTGIKAQRIDRVVAFRGSTGNADYARAPELGKLPHHAANRTGGSGHHQGLTCLGIEDPVRAVPRGRTRHAEQADVVGKRHALAIDLHDLVAGDHRVGLPAQTELRGEQVTRFEVGVLRLQHLAGCRALHHLVQGLRLCV